MYGKKTGLALALATALVLAISLMAAGCGSSGETGEKKEKLSGDLAISGSTTVLPLAQEAADMFMEENPDVNVNVQGGGSSVGISNVAEGVVQIGNSSRDLKDEEKNLGLTDHKIALDIIVIIVNKGVSVDNLSADQVKAIFTGKITNWKEVGGQDAPIVVAVRDSASGTREIFDEKALSKEKPVAGALETNSNGIMRQTVSSTPNCIGYISLGYLDGSVKDVKLGGVKGTTQTAIDKTYPISRYLHMFTKGEATGLARAYIDFVLSDDFQNTVVAKEYIPMTGIQ
jgi:phosphate transport system substrate-binding protein